MVLQYDMCQATLLQRIFPADIISRDSLCAPIISVKPNKATWLIGAERRSAGMIKPSIGCFMSCCRSGSGDDQELELVLCCEIWECQLLALDCPTVLRSYTQHILENISVLHDIFMWAPVLSVVLWRRLWMRYSVLPYQGYTNDHVNLSPVTDPKALGNCIWGLNCKW